MNLLKLYTTIFPRAPSLPSSAPRVILINECRVCPHSHDWSSGGLDCEHPQVLREERGRTVVVGFGSRRGAPIPPWCPLPVATAIEYPTPYAPAETKP